MKQFVIFFALMALAQFKVFSQDLIIKLNGEKIHCKITEEDSAKIFFVMNANGRSVDTYINKGNVQSYQYNVIKEKDSYWDVTSLGIGLGQDFGGIGVSVLTYPTKKLGIFGGIGYALAGAGFNAGIKYRFLPADRFRKGIPFILAMYGYNAAIKVINADQFNKLFYGMTFGFGFDLRSRPDKMSFWSLALLIPIRSGSVDNYMDDLKMNHGIQFKNELIPIGFSVGYRFIIN
jgi:hypothetical protein